MIDYIVKWQKTEIRLENVVTSATFCSRYTDFGKMLFVLALVLFAQLVVECDSSNHIKTNLVGEPDNIHTIYKSLFRMGMNNKKEDKEVVEKEKHIEIVNRISIPESEGIRLFISVIGMLWDTAWKVGALNSCTLVYMFGLVY